MLSISPQIVILAPGYPREPTEAEDMIAGRPRRKAVANYQAEFAERLRLARLTGTN